MATRVAVIGAGHHGLVAGIRLAGAGCEVLVLEAGDQPGGGVRSGELTRPGFCHDTCSAFFPLTAASPVFRELELDIEWVNPDVAMVHVLDEEGAAIALHRDLAATAGSLERCASGAGTAWQDLVNTLWPHRTALIKAGLAPLPPLRAGIRLIAGLRREAVELAPLGIGSAAAVGRTLFGDDRASGWLAGSGAHADLSPHAAGSGAFATGLNFLGHLVGWPFPRGGAARLTDALIARLDALGGQLRCGTAVEAIELERGRVRAVRLRGGERLSVDAAICTASPAPLLELLPKDALPGRVQRRLSKWRYGLGTVKLDWALSAAVPWASAAARAAGVVHLGGPLAEVAASLNQAKSGWFPVSPALVVGQQSLHDPTRTQTSGHTLYAYARVPQRPDLDREEMAERIEEQIERFAPGFRRLVIARSVRTPRDMEAENPSMRGGDLASGSADPDQQLIFRPDPALCRGRSPIAGLYVAGAWVHPGPGVHGVSGRAAADALLRHARRRRG